MFYIGSSWIDYYLTCTLPTAVKQLKCNKYRYVHKVLFLVTFRS